MSAQIATRPPSRGLGRVELLAILLLSLGILVFAEFRTRNYIADLIVSALSGAVLAGLVHLLWPDRAKHNLNRLNTTLLTSDQSPTSKRSTASPWLTVAPVVAPALAIVGIVIYSVVQSAYQAFYSPFGVDPSDLGYSYARTISGAIGLVLYLITLAVPFSASYSIVTCLLWSRTYDRIQPDSISRSEALRPLWMEFGLLLLISFLCIAAFYPPLILAPESRRASAQVQQGHAVRSGNLGPFVRLQIHADYARIGPASGDRSAANIGSPSITPVCHEIDVRDLYGKPFLYLGQANGDIVLYDSECRATILVPQSSIVLQISRSA
jgi:hypothetical protein